MATQIENIAKMDIPAEMCEAIDCAHTFSIEEKPVMHLEHRFDINKMQGKRLSK